ncbi:hypothetical protein PIB30_075295 [Stylosanthes scabra]|uniref:Uncharacterized protein n=1 Tax=Stylosanthes scabra TaxID=79078 RepID=A0ABU6RQR4_9FABA|nr:hypothetical protein [Stylosanthes scabra]
MRGVSWCVRECLCGEDCFHEEHEVFRAKRDEVLGLNVMEERASDEPNVTKFGCMGRLTFGMGWPNVMLDAKHDMGGESVCHVWLARGVTFLSRLKRDGR